MRRATPVRELARLTRALALLRLRDFAVARHDCPFCGPALVVRLRNEETGVRCLRCGASPVHGSLGRALQRHVGNLAGRRRLRVVRARPAGSASAQARARAWLCRNTLPICRRAGFVTACAAKTFSS